MRSIMMQIAVVWATFGGAKMQQLLGNTMEKMALVLSTCSTAEDADAMIMHLLQQGLIACGSVVPGVVSTYRWNNGIERSTEVQMVLKTTTALREVVVVRLSEIHPYETPEIVCLSPDVVHAPYFAWISDACRPTT